MMTLRGAIYRSVMRIAHRFDWHYAPPIYPDGDTQLRCHWCGFHQTVKRASFPDMKYGTGNGEKSQARITA